jgi:PTS system nitrogen regulatory IIA component
MNIADILTPARALCNAPGTSKKRALESIADFISQDIPSLDANALFKQLICRERLGSTAIGHGIAIPHCRMEGCTQITGALVKLAQPVDFDAMDDKPVDLLFVLLVPEQACEEHLQILKGLAQLFNSADTRNALRQAGDSLTLYEIAINAQSGESYPLQHKAGRGIV